jgi:hypothetical protein
MRNSKNRVNNRPCPQARAGVVFKKEGNENEKFRIISMLSILGCLTLLTVSCSVSKGLSACSQDYR